MEPEQARQAVISAIGEALAAVLGREAVDLEPDRPLEEYGFDSLIGAEVLMALLHRYNVDIAPMEMVRHGRTLSSIAGLVLLHLGLPDAAVPSKAGAVPSPRRAAEHGESPQAAAESQGHS